MDDKPKKQARWPGRLLQAVVAGLVFAAIFFPDADLSLLSSPYWTAGFLVSVGTVLAAHTVWSMRRTNPREVLAQQQVIENATGLKSSRAMRWLLVAGVALCIALLAVISFLIVPGERGQQVELFLYGSALIFAALSIPLVVLAAGWVFGMFMQPVRATGEFLLTIDGDAREALVARSNAHRVATVADGLSRAEALDDGTGRFRLYPDGMFARMLGMGQVVDFAMASDKSWMETRSLTDKGDSETLAYRVVSQGDGTELLACKLDSDLRNPFIKLTARILGPEHLIEGGAMVEAKRIGDMLGCEVEFELERASF